jgi:hypothetical protein
MLLDGDSLGTPERLHFAEIYKSLFTNKCTKRVLSSIVTHSYIFRPCWVIFRENFFVVVTLRLHFIFEWERTVNCVLCSFWRREAQRGSSSSVSLTSVLHVNGWSTPRSGRFIPGEKTWYPFYRRLGGHQGHLEGCGKSRPHLDSIPRQSSWTDYDTPTRAG